MAELKRPSSAADIWEVDDLQREDVPVPEWGMLMTVRGMTAGERDSFETSLSDSKGKPVLENIRARLVSRCVVDENGKRLFSDDDVAKLAKKAGKAVDRLFSAAQRLSGMSNRDIEELEKNFGAGPSDDSSSD